MKSKGKGRGSVYFLYSPLPGAQYFDTASKVCPYQLQEFLCGNNQKARSAVRWGASKLLFPTAVYIASDR